MEPFFLQARNASWRRVTTLRTRTRRRPRPHRRRPRYPPRSQPARSNLARRNEYVFASFPSMQYPACISPGRGTILQKHSALIPAINVIAIHKPIELSTRRGKRIHFHLPLSDRCESIDRWTLRSWLPEYSAWQHGRLPLPALEPSSQIPFRSETPDRHPGCVRETQGPTACLPGP